MLLRNRPPNQGLWNGVGGHIEPGESPRDACLREVYEETGYRLSAARFAGLLTWTGFETPPGGLYLFTASVVPDGAPPACDEGLLHWQTRDWIQISPEVVGNLHYCLPNVLDGAAPRVYHFDYDHGQIVHHEIRPLPTGFNIYSIV